MEVYGSHERKLPLTCRRGHQWGPAPLSVSWVPGQRPTAGAEPGHGHLVVHCAQPGCTETWQTDGDTLLAVLEDRSSQAGADRDSTEVMAAFDAVWSLFTQAHAHQRELLKATHPSAARLARLRSWIQDCVTATEAILQAGTVTARSDEVAQLTEIAARVSAVVDAFHMYATTLDRSRRAGPAAIGSARSEPLAAVADDERVLVNYRAELRESMRQLMAELQS